MQVVHLKLTQCYTLITSEFLKTNTERKEELKKKKGILSRT